MKKIFSLFILSFLALSLSAQTTVKRTVRTATPIRYRSAASVNVGGQSGNGVSLQYQHKIGHNQKSYLSIGGGLGVSQSQFQKTELTNKSTVNSLILPHNILYNFGNGNGHFGILGLGGTADFSNLGAQYGVSPMLGYRYQPTTSRLFFHLFFSPILYQKRDVRSNQCLECPIPDRNSVMSWGGVGAGWSF